MPKVRHTEHHPLPGTVDEVAEAVRRILALGNVEHLSLNLGEPIYVERMADPKGPLDIDEALGSHLTLEDMLQRVVLEEYVPPSPEMDPKAQLFDMFMLVSGGGFVPSYVLCSDAGRLRRWLGMEGILPDGFRLLNATVVEVAMFPSDVLVVFGGHSAGGAPADVKVALKLTIGGPSEGQAAGPVHQALGHPEADRPVPGGTGDDSKGDDAPVWFGPQG